MTAEIFLAAVGAAILNKHPIVCEGVGGMKYLTLTCLVLSAVGAPAIAQAQGKPTAKEDPNRMVCKTQAKAGTRFATRICKTRAEWDQMAEEHKRAAAEMAAPALPRGCDQPGAC